MCRGAVVKSPVRGSPISTLEIEIPGPEKIIPGPGNKISGPGKFFLGPGNKIPGPGIFFSGPGI
jgi:hypothetical protein